MSGTKLLIVGGSDAGIAAGLRAREVAPDTEVTVLVADAYPNYSICGIPYLVSGEVPDWRRLAHRTTEDLRDAGLRLRLDTTARAVDPVARTVLVEGGETIGYDKLVIGTGAVPVQPPIPGLAELGADDGVHLLHTMADTFAVLATLERRRPERALIVGAGYIGLEMAEALTTRGCAVTMVEQLHQVLPTFDAPLSELVAAEARTAGVEVVTGTKVIGITSKGATLVVDGDSDFRREVGLVLVCVGVRPDVGLAAGAGAQLGARGAIAVDRHMRTTVPDVYAAGDCVHTHHRLLDAPAYVPLGTTAHKQGRVAGENAVGGDRQYAGSLGTQVVKVFHVVAARTGLNDAEATAAGYDPVTVQSAADDHKAYYPGSAPIAMRWTGDRSTGRLLGVQLVGRLGSEIAKRVDVAATAIHHGATVDDVSDLDLSYTPPLGSPWDALQIGAQQWQRHQENNR